MDSLVIFSQTMRFISGICRAVLFHAVHSGYRVGSCIAKCCGYCSLWSIPEFEIRSSGGCDIDIGLFCWTHIFNSGKQRPNHSNWCPNDNHCVLFKLLGWPMDDHIGWQFWWHVADVCVGHFRNYCHFLFLWIGECVHRFEIHDRTKGDILLAHLLVSACTASDVHRLHLFEYYDETVNIFRPELSNHLFDNRLEYIWICNAPIAPVVHLALDAKQSISIEGICECIQVFAIMGTTVSNRSKRMDEISRRDEAASSNHCKCIRTFKAATTIQFSLWQILNTEIKSQCEFFLDPFLLAQLFILLLL